MLICIQYDCFFSDNRVQLWSKRIIRLVNRLVHEEKFLLFIRDHRVHRSHAQRERVSELRGHCCRRSVTFSSQPSVMHSQQALTARQCDVREIFSSDIHTSKHCCRRATSLTRLSIRMCRKKLQRPQMIHCQQDMLSVVPDTTGHPQRSPVYVPMELF